MMGERMGDRLNTVSQAFSNGMTCLCYPMGGVMSNLVFDLKRIGAEL
jgi:hypothetical protein